MVDSPYDSGQPSITVTAPVTAPDADTIRTVGDDLTALLEEMGFTARFEVTSYVPSRLKTRADEVRQTLRDVVAATMRRHARENDYTKYMPKKGMSGVSSDIDGPEYDVTRQTTAAVTAFLDYAGLEKYPKAASLYQDIDFGVGVTEGKLPHRDELVACVTHLREATDTIEMYDGHTLTLTLTPPETIHEPETVVRPVLHYAARHHDEVDACDPVEDPEDVVALITAQFGEIEQRLDTLAADA